MVKSYYKKRLLQEIVAGDRRNSIKLIKHAIAELDKSKIQACIENGENEI
jgi:hypothetical protein